MNFKGKAQRLDSIDISRQAHTIGCGEDHVHAFLEVETRGGGFDKYGRVKQLFEPHVFYRELSGAERQEAIAAGLAYRRWGEQPYPRDSYPRLLRAMQINADAALRSCSWGLGQIMGFNCKLAGYSTAAAMVEAFVDDEAVQLAGAIEFIVSSGLDDELRREDWRGFARGYNGAGYAKHGYHTKLKRAFDKWQRIPDTPFTPEDIDRTEQDPNPPQEPIRTTRGMVLRRGMRGPDVENLQGILTALGYPSGAQDGIFGRLLHGAVVRFQSEHDLVPDGEVGELTWEALEKAKPEPLRAATVDTLRARGSSTIELADKGEKKTKLAAASVGGLGLLEVGREAVGTLSGSGGALSEAQAILMDNWPIILIVAIAGLAYYKGPQIMQLLRDIRVRDHITGRNLGR